MILVLFMAFAISVYAMIMADKHEKSCSSAVNEHTQPSINIHNNSYGGNCTSNSYGGDNTSDNNSHGGTSASDSNGYGGQSDSRSRGGNSDSCSTNTNSNKKNNSTRTTKDNTSEQIIQDHINRLREELASQRQVDIEMLEQLIKLEELANRGK